MSTKKFDEFVNEYAFFDEEGKVKWTDPNTDKEKRKKELLEKITDDIELAHKEGVSMEEIEEHIKNWREIMIRLYN